MAINKRLIKSNDEGGGASFNTVTYTGNGGTQSVTGIGFEPDLVWIKHRNGTSFHNISDSVRGSLKIIQSNTTTAEQNAPNGGVSSFNSDGFTLGSSTSSYPDVSGSGQNYVAWCWKAGGAAVTNTDGTITSQVSANTEAGFSIVSYTGNGVNPGASIGHGLKQNPDFIVAKSRSTGEWPAFHSALPITNTVYWNATYASSTYINRYSAINENTFTTGSNGSELNANGVPYIAYCFAEVAGFSKFGSYVGNGNDNGPTIDCNFEPAFVMIKSSSLTGSWRIWDNKRSPSNPRNEILKPNESEAEETNSPNAVIDFLENGFQPKSTHSSVNASGASYIYMAFANQF